LKFVLIVYNIFGKKVNRFYEDMANKGIEYNDSKDNSEYGKIFNHRKTFKGGT